MTAPLAAAGTSAYWYLARGTGAVSLVLLTGSVVLGVLGSLRFDAGPRWPRFAIDSLHRDVSLLVLLLLVVHIATSVLDGFAPVTLLDSVIPFGSAYRPLWLGLGALSFDLILAVLVTSWLRRRIGYGAWRTVHWLAYASWPIAVLHGLGTGSDTKLWWMLGLTLACVTAVLIAVWTRLARAQPGPSGAHGPAVALSIATPIGLALFTLLGPLQRGWARKAGTPSALLAKPSVPISSGAGAGAGSTASGGTPAGQFSARLSGTLTQTPEPGGAIVELTLRLSGATRGRLRVRLGGVPLGGGGLSMTGSQVDLAASGLPSVMDGRIVSLQGQQFLARVASSSGSVLDLRADLKIDSQRGIVTGTLSATPAGSGG